MLGKGKKDVLSYNDVEARQYFLNERNYFSLELPKYFVFQPLLDKISQNIDGKILSSLYVGKNYSDPSNFENVNYTFLNNKDGKYSWRPFQLIHPLLYVSLVHKITETNHWKTIVDRFKEFDSNPRIKCYSIPLESEKNFSNKAISINQWWQSIEQ
jgi:hypothetical protein